MSTSDVVLQEQVINDNASGLTLTIWRTSDGEGRIRICGQCLPLGNRDLHFSPEGEMIGAGTALVDAYPVSLRLLD